MIVSPARTMAAFFACNRYLGTAECRSSRRAALVEAADLGQAIAKAAILHSRMEIFQVCRSRWEWTAGSSGLGWADIERVPVRPSSSGRERGETDDGGAPRLENVAGSIWMLPCSATSRASPQRNTRSQPDSSRVTLLESGTIRGTSSSPRYYETVLEGLEIFENDPLLFEPGTQYSYSTYGWNLRKNYSKVRSANVETSLTKIRFPEMVGCRPRLAIGNLVALDWLECGAAVSHDDELGVFFEREDRLTRADDGCVFRLPWVARSTGAHRY